MSSQMSVVAVMYAACMSIVLVSGQLFGGNFGYGYNSVAGDFGGPSAFGGSLGVGPANVRDPRQNRGEYRRNSVRNLNGRKTQGRETRDANGDGDVCHMQILCRMFARTYFAHKHECGACIVM